MAASPQLSLPCLHCGAGVRFETAVAFVLEVIEGDGGDPRTWRVLERHTLFHMHPACAERKRRRIEPHVRNRYRQREGWFIAVARLPVDPGRPWACS